MGVRIPRVTIKTDFGDAASFGDLNLLSLGYGLHQAWIYAVMFSTSAMFSVRSFESGIYGSNVAHAFLASIVTFSICLLLAGATDQKFLRLYVSRKTLATGAILMSIGTALLIPSFGLGDIHSWLIEITSGVFTGVGSAILILFWGTAFSRLDSASIILNSTFSIVIGLGIYALGFRHLPAPLGAILVSAVPLIELAILWFYTPKPYTQRNDIPIFKPLPVNHGSFVLRFGAPVFVLGLALGVLRQTSIQAVLPTISSINAVLVALCATALILITVIALGGANRWNRLFRPLIPLIAVSSFFIPFSMAGDTLVANLFILVGYMCFEALMWMFFGEMCQRFRLSPVLVFGIGRGLMSGAAFIGSIVPIFAGGWVSLVPFGDEGVIVFILLTMVVAYTLLPSEREMTAIVAPCPLVFSVHSALEESESGQEQYSCPGSDSKRPKRSSRNRFIESVGRTPGDENAKGTDVTKRAMSAELVGTSAVPAELVARVSRLENAARAGQAGQGVDTGQTEQTLGGQNLSDQSADNQGAQGVSVVTGADSERTENASGQAALGQASLAGHQGGVVDSNDIADSASARHMEGDINTPSDSFTTTANPRPTIATSTGNMMGMTGAGGATNAADASNNQPRRPFKAKVERVANHYLLSRRETEVLFFLAKGHNSAYIQEKLFISEGTAKTHIRHIYHKLDVHNQQQLMRMVEDAETPEGSQYL